MAAIGPALIAAAVIVAVAGSGLACGSGDPGGTVPAAAALQLPHRIFDRMALGMTRSEIAAIRPIRPSVPAGGRDLRIWVYERRGEYAVRLTFSGTNSSARLRRIDVHYGRQATPADQFIAPFERRFGPPDVRRRRAVIPAYGDAGHDQYDTIWSDASRYVYLTEKVPKEGQSGRTAYFLTVKEKEITAAGPPTGYVPPPPPEGEEAADDPFF